MTFSNNKLAASVAAWLFVVIWSSGFVVARGISGQIDPYLFLLLRFSCVVLIFFMLMRSMRVRAPAYRDQWRLLGIGALMQGLYLGPGFWAVSQGLEAGVMALLGAMQPAMTAVLAWYFFSERTSPRTVIGLAIGIAGVALAVAPGMSNGPASASISLPVIAAAVVSITSITAGTVLQKSSIVAVPLLTTVSFQTLGAVMVMLLMNLLFGQWTLTMTPEILGYLVYAVLVLSIGGFTLLTWLVRSGSATRASSLLLVVPPLAALMSWWLYDEALSGIQVAGFIIALIGVVLARSRTS